MRKSCRSQKMFQHELKKCFNMSIDLQPSALIQPSRERALYRNSRVGIVVRGQATRRQDPSTGGERVSPRVVWP